MIAFIVLVLFLSGCSVDRKLYFDTGHFKQMESESSNRFIGLWEKQTLDTSAHPTTLSFQEQGRGVFDSADKHVDFEYEILNNWTLKYTEDAENPIELRYWFEADNVLVLEMPSSKGKTNVTWTRVVFKTVQLD